MATLLALVELCGYAIEDLGRYAVASATGSTVSITALDNDTTGASNQRYNRAKVCIASGAATLQQRVVTDGGYAPATNTLTIEPDWTTTPSAGQVALITREFPVLPGLQGERTDYRTMVNRGLAKIFRERRIGTSATTSRTHDLSTWKAWLQRPEQIVDYLEASPVSGGRLVSAKWRGPRLNLNADTPTVELKAPFSSAASLTIVARAPSNTWIRTSGTWAETSPSTGLVNFDDEAMPSETDVVKAFKVEAYSVLMAREPGKWDDAYATALADARATIEGYEWPGQPAPVQEAA